MFSVGAWIWRNRIAVGTAVMLAAAGVVVYELRPRPIHFIEQVQLSSGEIINVEREYKANKIGEIGGPGGWEPAYMTLEIKPNLMDVLPEWKSDAGLVPILLDKEPDGGAWTLLATFYTCEPWYALGRPQLPYAEFQIVDQVWKRVEFDERWIGRRANVSANLRADAEPRLLTIAEKVRRDSEPGIAREYVQIVGKWTSGC